MTDIVAAAQAHLASLPQHLKSRYSAVLIANLVEEIEDLQELRKLDGESLGKSVEEYNRMKELCVNGGCSSGLDSETDRKSAATQGSAHSCCQPFDSAPVTSQKPVAWVRFYPNGGPQSVYLDRPPPDAEPLYRATVSVHPTISADERAVLEAILYRHRAAEGTEIRTIRDLLARFS